MTHAFVSANDVTCSAKRSTITPKDVLKALDEIDFGHWKEVLEKLLAGASVVSLHFNSLIY